MGGSKVKVTPDASVSLRIGEVPGAILENGVRQYLGVPYAEPLASRESVFELPAHAQAAAKAGVLTRASLVTTWMRTSSKCCLASG